MNESFARLVVIALHQVDGRAIGQFFAAISEPDALASVIFNEAELLEPLPSGNHDGRAFASGNDCAPAFNVTVTIVFGQPLGGAAHGVRDWAARGMFGGWR